MKLFILFIILITTLFADVDMNNATAIEFTKLKGVGAKKSVDIVKYRQAHGCFKSIGELTRVKGIGAKTLKKNRADLVLGKCSK